jgi:alpha-L-glutamate ligase-like protein
MSNEPKRENDFSLTEKGWRHRFRKNLPFILFIAVLAIYTSYLQLTMRDSLLQLFLVRNFFQVVIAALVIATMKNVFGLRTLGTFGPAIVALAFLSTGLLLGLGLFALILAAVFTTRAALAQQHIQGAHRVAILVSMIGVLVSTVTLIGLQFEQHELFYAVLFPVLISAWMGESYVEETQRVGWGPPTIDLAGTIVAVVVSFVVITQDWFIDFVMANPTTWLVIVLANWFLGTRIRLRIGEYFRFWGPIHYGGDDPGPGDYGADVLTMVVRNRDFVAKYNPMGVMARMGKDEVKKLLQPYGIPIAKTYLAINRWGEIDSFRNWMSIHNAFAVKPNRGYGGEGILLVKGGGWYGNYDTNMGVIDAPAIESHIRSILDGEFHDGGDSALVEELLREDSSLQEIAPVGLADFRIICFLGYPVMAMMRIPTNSSGGKANLHSGAMAAGVQISTGTITHAVLQGMAQPFHPDSGDVILGRKVPDFDEILEVAAEAQRLTGLGFAGVDVCLVAGRGPVVMEVNRRPGLEIQNANAAGLLRRLRIIEKLPRREKPVEARVELAKRLDSGGWQLPIEQSSELVAEKEEGAPSERKLEDYSVTAQHRTIPRDFYSGKARAIKASAILLVLLIGSSTVVVNVDRLDLLGFISPHVGESEWAFTMTGVRQLNAMGFTGRGITVCIVDTGIDLLHPDFTHLHLAAWWDLVNFRTVPYDDKGHGTAMAGLVAANGSLKGGAPGVQLIVVKALDSSGKGTSENVANGVHLCVFPGKGIHGADIISLSLGPSAQGTGPQDTNVYDAVAWATSQGVYVVSSAGNNGASNNGDVELPGQVPLAISVGAVDIQGHHPVFSSIGSSINRTDPNLKPEVAAPGVRLVSTGTDSRYLTVTGTSPSAALVAAVLALLLEARPSLRPNGSWQNVVIMKEALTQGAHKATGQMLPHDPWYGYGIIDGVATLRDLNG